MSTWIFVFFMYHGPNHHGVNAPGVVPDLKSREHCQRVFNAIRTLPRYNEGYCLEVKP